MRTAETGSESYCSLRGGLRWFAWVQRVFAAVLVVDRLGISAWRPPTDGGERRNRQHVHPCQPDVFGSGASDIRILPACLRPGEGPRRGSILFRSLRCGFVLRVPDEGHMDQTYLMHPFLKRKCRRWADYEPPLRNLLSLASLPSWIFAGTYRQWGTS